MAKHKDKAHKEECDDCKELFDSVKALRSHQEKDGHLCCEECKRRFRTKNEYTEHMHSTVHPSQFRCLDCQIDFSNEERLLGHLDAEVHKPRSGVMNGGSHRCETCCRTFHSRNELVTHLASKIHRPVGKLRCLMSSKCIKSFNSPSALIQHLENGACHSGLNRAKLNQLVQKHDMENRITIDFHRLSLADSTVTGKNLTSTSTRNITPSSTSVVAKTSPKHADTRFRFADISEKDAIVDFIEPTANEDSSLNCPLCAKNSKTFRTVRAFREHLDSPAHDPTIYHCPIGLIPKAKGAKEVKALLREFSTLGALTMHVESGACEGGKLMLKSAMEVVEGKLRSLGFGEIRLLR